MSELVLPEKSGKSRVGILRGRHILHWIADRAKPQIANKTKQSRLASPTPKNLKTLKSPRALQYELRPQIVQQYRVRAGITQPVHPHLFRHQMLTYLTAQGLSDAQIQLISGHESKKSLERYQHLSLQSVEQAYQGGPIGRHLNFKPGDFRGTTS